MGIENIYNLTTVGGIFEANKKLSLLKFNHLSTPFYDIYEN